MDKADADWAVKELTEFSNAINQVIACEELASKAVGPYAPFTRSNLEEAHRNMRRGEEVSRRIIERAFDRPIETWSLHDLHGQRATGVLVHQAIGLISKLSELDRRLKDPGPRMTATEFHNLIWTASSRLWSNGHYMESVQSAAASVNTYVQSLVSRTDVSDAVLMREVFSAGDPEVGKPRLRWPGDVTDRTVKTMNDGLRSFASGAFSAIRNPVAHGKVELSESQAFEQLASLSMLMRWIDECQLLEVNSDDGE